MSHCACAALASANILATVKKSELHADTQIQRLSHCMHSLHAHRCNSYTHFNGCTVNCNFPSSTDSIALSQVTQTPRMMSHAYRHSCNCTYIHVYKPTLFIFTSCTFHLKSNVDFLEQQAIAPHDEAPRISRGHNMQSASPIDSCCKYEIYFKWRMVAVITNDYSVLARLNVHSVSIPGSSG